MVFAGTFDLPSLFIILCGLVHLIEVLTAVLRQKSDTSQMKIPSCCPEGETFDGAALSSLPLLIGTNNLDEIVSCATYGLIACDGLDFCCVCPSFPHYQSI